jgi:DNA polymerase elongation subunit (family B)
MKSKLFIDDLARDRQRLQEARRQQELRHSRREVQSLMFPDLLEVPSTARPDDRQRLREARRRQAERHARKEMEGLRFADFDSIPDVPRRFMRGPEFAELYRKVKNLPVLRKQSVGNAVTHRFIYNLDANELIEGTRMNHDHVVYASLMNAMRELQRVIAEQVSHVHVRLVFQRQGNSYLSMGLNNPQNMTLREMIDIYEAWLVKRNESGSEVELTGYYISVVHLPNDGGCDEGRTHSYVLNDFYPHCRLWMTSPKSKGNNCLFSCFNHALCLRGNKSHSARIRKEIGAEKDAPIKWQDVHKVAQQYQVNVELYTHPLANENDVRDHYVYAEDAPTVRIHLINGHYVLESKRSSLYCCIECGAGMRIDPKTGKKRMCKGEEGQTTCETCSPLQKNFYQRHKKRLRILPKRAKKLSKRVPLDKLVFFDLETFQAPDKDYSEAYSVGFMRGDEMHPTIFYGPDCLTRFIEFAKGCEETVFIAFNGARFDHYFLVNRLLKDKVPITQYKTGENKVVVSSGRVLQFEFDNGNKLWDLCLFLQSSLDKAGRAFGCEVAKGDFNHELVKSWSDAEHHRAEIVTYLEKDVLLLKELHLRYAEEVFKTEGLEVTDFLTMPQMAFLAWILTLANKTYDIHMPYALTDYVASRDSRYGGRCYPLKHRWESEVRDVDWQKLYDSNDFYVAVDIVSQYPAVMRGCKMLPTSYPVGPHRQSLDPLEDFSSGLFGIFHVRYTPNRAISVPILPRRNNGLDWDLLPGTGWYTNIDLLNAVEFGYDIEFTGRAYVWDQTTNDLFTEFIDRYFEMKKLATRDGNKVIRLYSKISMNSLYGKLQQRPFDTVQLWSNDGKEIQDFLSDKTLDDLHLFEDANLWMVTAKKSDANLVASVTKPLHIGAFILSYSRRLYLEYLKIIDPTLTRPDLFIYTDTDSFFVSGKDYKKLQEANVFGEDIGMLSNDIANDGLITHFIAFAPKTYYGIAVNNENKIVTKCGLKGIPNKQKKAPGEWLEMPRYSEHEPHLVQLEDGAEVDLLNYFDFMAGTEKPRDVEFTSFQKIHTKAGKQEPFSVNVHKTKRTAFKSLWKGMPFDGNTWSPKGYLASK